MTRFDILSVVDLTCLMQHITFFWIILKCWLFFTYNSYLARCNASWPVNRSEKHMMTSSNGNIFRVTVPLCGEFIGHRWIPLTKASFGVFFICAWIDVIRLLKHSLLVQRTLIWGTPQTEIFFIIQSWLKYLSSQQWNLLPNPKPGGTQAVRPDHSCHGTYLLMLLAF